VGISAGGFHSLVIKKDGTVVAWGANGYQQCDVPTSLTDVVGISGGGSHSLVIKKGQQ
jgi:alpha-tubulin suppressor-like RCC1 family protein